jgi:hypothetical protein
MSIDQVTSINISKENVEAEIACISGKAQKLSAYFQRPDKPLADVVRNIAYALLATAENPGPGNWNLVLSTRIGGRPPKNQPQPTNAAQALETGQVVPAGMYLLAKPETDEATQRILAAVLDPCGTSKWQLKFVRPRRKGNPRSDLRTDLNRAVIDQVTNDVHAQAKARGTETNLDAIYPRVKREIERRFPSIKAGKSTIRAARAAVQRSRGKNPPL